MLQLSLHLILESSEFCCELAVYHFLLRTLGEESLYILLPMLALQFQFFPWDGELLGPPRYQKFGSVGLDLVTGVHELGLGRG